MSLKTVRKSGRIKTRKKTTHMSEDFEYDENKFDPEDESNMEIQTKSNVDISTNISHLLHSHSEETNVENVHLNNSLFPNVLSKLQGESEESLGGDLLDNYNNGSGQLFSCDVCGKMLADISSYDRHMKSHSSDRRFHCGQCEKTFLDSCSLKRHLKTHEDDRPFSCEICQKSFRDTASISRHMLTHTERPRMFQCSMCDKNFTDKTGLKRHEKTHTGLRPFVCEVCQKAFMDSCSFKRHQKIHIGIKNFHCPKCQRSFMEKQSLVRHQKTVCKFLDDSSSGVGHSVDGDDSSNPSNDLHQIGSQKNFNNNNSGSFPADEDGKDHSNHSFSSGNSNTNSLSVSTVTPSLQFTSLNSSETLDNLVSTVASQQTKVTTKGQPSLGSLIKKDPGLYDSISEIVESIDSYEKMLDLCGDQGQKEIDAALTRDPVPMPNNLLCFECGELLVDGGNFRSEGKVFHPTMTNAFKCLNCEEEDEDDEEEYGDPPVLMPHYDQNNDNETETPLQTSDVQATENFYGTDEPMEQFQDRLKKQHGVYFVENGNNYNQNDEVDSESDTGNVDRDSFSQPLSTTTNEELRSSLVSEHKEPHKSKNNQRQKNSYKGRQQSTDLSTLANISQSGQLKEQTGEQPKLEYEADDPTIPSVFPCHLCTKVFASASFLAQHLSLHKKSPHKCMVCTKSFTSGPALKRHMRLHTGEKPYVCPICQKQFRDPSNFGKHKKNCINILYSDTGPISPASCMPCPSLDDSFSSDNLSQSFPGLPVEKGEIQPMGRRKGNKSKPGRGRRRRRNEKIETIENVVPSDVIDENLDNVPMIDKDDSIHYDPDDLGGNDMTGGNDESYPVMTVMPSLDDDDEISNQSDEDDVEKNESGAKVGKEEENRENDDIKDGEKKINYIACKVCQKLCENQDHLVMHMNYHSGNPNVTCIECGKSFADSFGMKRHMRTHLGIRPFTCEYCGRGYCDNWSLKKHKSKGCVKAEIKVPIDYLHPCPKCAKVFCDEENLLVHLKVHKGLIPNRFECDVCHKGFSEAFNLKKHRRLHMAICPGCGQEFENIQLLNDHQESKCKASTPAKDTDDGKSFSCEICGRVYSTRAYLDRHRKIHSGIKPHVCEICNKRFSEAFKLRRHKKSSHSDEKPFICQDCGKCFSDDDALKRHAVSSSCALNKVMGETVNSENCACQFCDKVFQKSYMLVRHMAVHSQDRPFACEVCGRSYKDTSSLKRHQVIHQGVKDYICPTCGTDFYYSDSLKRHMGGRCGKKTKTRRRKAVQWIRPKKRYPKKTVAKIDVLSKDGNDKTVDNNNISDISTSYKRNLHTQPYIPEIIPEPKTSFSIPPAKKKLKREGKWSCRLKKHCWLCDTKTLTASALIYHVRRVHSSNNQKRFSCRKCFLRFHKKVYWKAHVSCCNNQIRLLPPKPSSNNNNVRKVTRRRTVASTNYDVFSVPPDDAYDDMSSDNVNDKRRPRRSVPRAKWSWISQI